MRNLKTFTAVAAVAVLMGVVGVSAASATVTFHGTISGSTWAGAVGPCDFSITSTTGPGTNGVLQGGTFVGRGTTQPCDASSLTITNNISVTYPGGSTMNATLGQIVIDDNNTGCTYRTSTSGLGITNNTTLGNNGIWSGSGTATSSNFPCNFAPANISVSGFFT